MTYYSYVDGVLGAEVSGGYFGWSYGTVAPCTDKSAFDKCAVKIHLEIKKDTEVFPADKKSRVIGKFHYFSGNPEESTVYYERNFFFGKKLKYVIRVEEKDIWVTVGKTYYKWIKHRFMNLHSISYILTDLTAGLLLLNGYATLHCSAVNFPENGHSAILFAPPNTGKTLSSMMLCRNRNANFIAEDFAVTDGENVWSVPWTSTFRFYDEVNESKLEKQINKISTVIPVIELIPTTKSKPINAYIDNTRIVNCSKATDVVVLERGDTSVSGDASDALRKLLTLNRYEFNYHKAPAMTVLCYFNPRFSQEDMFDREKAIIRKLLDNTKYTCITDRNAMNYSELIYKEIVG